MLLSPDSSLGRYKVLSQLGAGGMGEVYLALDSQLERTIALKVLPAHVATDEDRMRRFVLEAKAAPRSTTRTSRISTKLAKLKARDSLRWS